MYHNIGYHDFADDTLLYISFKCKLQLEAISKLNSCLADVRRWMRLLINYRLLGRKLNLLCLDLHN